jgi:uncharacterized integral membrane protein
MRIFWLILLIIFLAAVSIFAWQNHEPVSIHYLDRSVSVPFWLVIAAVYVLGMFTGWSVVGFLKRSFRRVTEAKTRTQ